MGGLVVIHHLGQTAFLEPLSGAARSAVHQGKHGKLRARSGEPRRWEENFCVTSVESGPRCGHRHADPGSLCREIRGLEFPRIAQLIPFSQRNGSGLLIGFGDLLRSRLVVVTGGEEGIEVWVQVVGLIGYQQPGGEVDDQSQQADKRAPAEKLTDEHADENKYTAEAYK